MGRDVIYVISFYTLKNVILLYIHFKSWRKKRVTPLLSCCTISSSRSHLQLVRRLQPSLLGSLCSINKIRDLQIVFFSFESAVRFVFESNLRIESAVYTTQAVTRPDVQAYNMLTTSIVNEREWRTELSTYSFQFSPKTRQTMPL